MKKWENPKLERLSLKDTQCGAWKYLYNCTNINITCDYYDFSVSPNFERPCQCGGIIRVVGKHWSDSYCTGECS